MSIGTAESRLIIIRGNSGSGKSLLARDIRAARPRGVAIAGQDQLRREVLRLRVDPVSVGYIDLTARYALEHGMHVVVEGILDAGNHAEMLTHLRADHAGITRCYYYRLTLAETLARHRTKPLAAEVTEEEVTSWYRADDVIPALDETVFGPDVALETALAQVLADVDWEDVRHER